MRFHANYVSVSPEGDYYQIWIETKEFIKGKFTEEERRCHFSYDG